MNLKCDTYFATFPNGKVIKFSILSIGFLSDGSAQTLGIIDDVLVTDRALTEEEVKAVMQRGVLGTLSVDLFLKLPTTWAEIKSLY